MLKKHKETLKKWEISPELMAKMLSYKNINSLRSSSAYNKRVNEFVSIVEFIDKKIKEELTKTLRF